MKKIIPVFILILVLLFFLKFSIYSENGSDSRIRFSGNVEIDEVNLSFRIPGVLSKRNFSEGDFINKGDLLAELDADEVKIQVDKAMAQLSIERATLAELEAGARIEDRIQAAAEVQRAKIQLQQLENGPRHQEVRSARENLAGAKARLDSSTASLQKALKDEKRYSNLFSAGAIGEREYINYLTIYKTALENQKSAQASYNSAKNQLNLMEEGTRSEEIDKARQSLKIVEAKYESLKNGSRKEQLDRGKARVMLASASLDAAMLNESYLSLSSPMDGVVLSEGAEIGEYMIPGKTVLSVGNLDNVWMRGYVNETKIGHVKLGQKVAVFCDTFPGEKFEGQITFISSQSEFTPKSVQTSEERVKLVYRVKVNLNNAERKFKPGMPVDGELEIE